MTVTLIFTAFIFVAEGMPAGQYARASVHTEHDYPSVAACQKAAEIAKAQYTSRGYLADATCLKVE